MQPVTCHGAKGDETDDGFGWQEAQCDDDGFFEGLKLVFVEAGVDEKQEHGWHKGGAGQGILHGDELGVELHGHICFGHVCIVGGKGIALQTKGANPELGTKVHLASGCCVKERT